MAYRFKTGDQTLTEGLQRIAAEEFAAIGATLDDPSLPMARKVHECRKGTKRLRALIRLTADGLPDARAEIAALRASAASLSALRDRAALGEVLERLALPPETTASLAAALARRPMPGPSEQARRLARFRTEMDAIAARAQDWSLAGDGWKGIGPGVARGYRRLRHAMQQARKTTQDDPVHAFRKRAKDYWYHTLLLHNVFADVMDGYAAAAEQLGDDLGDWRDLGLLQAHLAGLPARTLAKREAAAALDVIARARRRSLRRALATGARLTAETEDAYCERLRSWWKAWA